MKPFTPPALFSFEQNFKSFIIIEQLIGVAEFWTAVSFSTIDFIFYQENGPDSLGPGWRLHWELHHQLWDWDDLFASTFQWALKHCQDQLLFVLSLLSRHSSDKSTQNSTTYIIPTTVLKHFTLRKHFATHDPTYVAKYSNKTPDHMGLVRQIWQTVLHDGVQSPASLCGGLWSILWHKLGHQSSPGPQIAIKRRALKIVKFCLTIFTAFVLPNANALRLFT